jgi:hypothetical protein
MNRRRPRALRPVWLIVQPHAITATDDRQAADAHAEQTAGLVIGPFNVLADYRDQAEPDELDAP